VRSVGEVRLAVPARPEYIGLARVTAAGLASRLGFTYDQVEDLRLAIDEMCFGLTGPDGREGTLEVHFSLAPEGLTVRGEGRFPLAAPLRLSAVSELILDALVDEHRLQDGAAGPHFVLVKRLLDSPAPSGGAGE
jgi:hypothetical protein